MAITEIKQLTEEMQVVFEEFKKTNEEKAKEVNKLGEETKETRNKLDRMHDRLDILETKIDRPKLATLETPEVESDYHKSFTEYFTKGSERIKSMDVKATFPNLNETIDPQGGYYVPPEWSNFIVDSLVQWSPVRELSTVIRMNRKELRIPVQQQAQNHLDGTPMAGMFKTSWGDEFGPINQTDTGLIGQKTLVACNLNAFPFATSDMLDDFAYGSLEGYIRENIAKSLGYAEGRAFIWGDGITQPTGLLNDTSIYQNVNAVGTANTIGDSADLLINAFYTLPAEYADNGTWLMNRQTVRIIREWVDGQGRYLWLPATAAATDAPRPTILERPFRTAIDMPAPTAVGGETYEADSTPILFGDFRAAYFIGDRLGMTVLRDPYSNKPYVGYWFRSRVAGNVILPEALCAVNVAS